MYGLLAPPSVMMAAPRSIVTMASPESEPPPLDTGLLAADGGICLLYSFSSSIAALFTSGEFLDPSLVVSSRDLVDLTVAFDSATALALGWCLACAIAPTGVCADWLGRPLEEHAASALGVKGVFANWLIGFPLGEILKAIALYGIFVGGWASQSELPLASASDFELARNVALDGAGLLVALTLWRRWLLNYMYFG